MARLPAGLVWAVAVLVVLGVGVSPGHGQLLGFPVSFPYATPLDPVTKCLASTSQYPWYLFPGLYDYLARLPPLRIVSQANSGVSVAVDGSNKVVLAETNCADPSQLWFQHYFVNVAPEAGQCNKVFALVNLANLFRGQRLKALVFSDDTGAANYEATMAEYDPACVPVTMLWTQDDPRPGYFSKIRALKNGSFVVDALSGIVRAGTIVGVYPEIHNDPNVLWTIKGYLS